jgi:ABC-type dipeptide/oligopeptide/nickel transport system permease component
MARYVGRRALYTLVVLFIASIVVFYGLRVAPGQPDSTLFNPYASQAAKNALRNELGLNKPVVVQYLDFLGNLFRGDLGHSIKSGQSIPTLIGQYGKNSLLLVGAAALFTYLLAVPLGVIAAMRRGGIVDHLLTAFASVAMGIPNFLLGLILVLTIGSSLHWLPISGTGGVKHLILPVIALSGEGIGVSLRLMRSSMVEQLDQDYVRALRAKGLSERYIVWRRVLRNGLLPIISLSGIQIGALVGYTAIVEIIFRWPGLGQLLVSSVLERDYPVALWLSLLLTACVVLANFVANVAYAAVDPRIRIRSAAV